MHARWLRRVEQLEQGRRKVDDRNPGLVDRGPQAVVCDQDKAELAANASMPARYPHPLWLVHAALPEGVERVPQIEGRHMAGR